MKRFFVSNDRPADTGRFPAIGGASKPGAKRSVSERLWFAAIALANHLLPKKADRIVLHSTLDIEDGVLAVAQGLVDRGWRPVFLVSDMNRVESLRRHVAAGCRFVDKGSKRGLWLYLTARYVVVTHGIYGGLKPPRRQIVVNLWHGEPGAKIVGRFEGQPGVQSTFAPVASTLGRAYRAAMFDLHPLQAPIIGNPRNDRMMDADVAVSRSVLAGDHPPAERIFLWLPTFRKAAFQTRRMTRLRDDLANGGSGALFDSEDMAAIDQWLSANGSLLVVKPHPHAVDEFSGEFSAVRVLRQSDLIKHDVTLYRLMAGCDCLITDVSSVWQDFLLLDRPMIFAFPDIDQYRASRGMNMEPYEDWVPGPLVRNAGEMTLALDDVVSGRDSHRAVRRSTLTRLHRYPDGNSTQRLLDGIGISRRS
jgi:CDP-glycerol glycerophosphotransferase (TagB/SpsB family)